MKKKIVVLTVLLAVVLSAVASGCGRNALGAFGKSPKSLYLHADMAVQDVVVEDFDTKTLVFDEYKGFLDAEVSEYNATHPFNPGDPKSRGNKEPEYTAPITVVNCAVEGNTLYQQLIYANITDYMTFNASAIEEMGGSFVKTGTLASVDTEVLMTSFKDTKGKDVDVQSLCLSTDAKKYRYIVADFDCTIYGDGDIVAIADGMKYSKENSCVGTGSAKLAVVIYK